MNKRTTTGLVLAAALSLAVLAAACGGLADNAPAKVGDVLIDNEKFMSQVESYASQYGIDQEADPDTYATLASDVLDSLITTELAAQKAADLGITVTEAEVQTRIKSIIDDYYNGDESVLVAELEAESLTLDDLAVQVGDFLLVGKVRDEVTKDVAAPSDEEITAYYQDHLTDYFTQETIEARHILVAVGGEFVRGQSVAEDTTSTTEYPDLDWARALATASDLRVQLLTGGSWPQLAARYSDDAETKNKGGALGTLVQGDLIEAFGGEFDNVLFSLLPDEISEPVKTANGYHLIQITSVNEPRQQTLDEARDAIAGLLLSQAQEVTWQAFIEQVKTEIEVVYRKDLRPATTTTSLPAAGQTTSTEAGF